MDKKRRRIDRAQNLAIFLLTVSAVFLLMQTPLVGDRSGTLFDLRALFSEESSAAPSEELSLETLSIPVRIAASNGFMRSGSDALTTADPALETVLPYLTEAVGSAHDAVSVPQSEFISALSGVGLYLDFTCELPLDVFAASLGVSAPNTRQLSVRRCLLSIDETASVLLYLHSTDGVYRFATEGSAAALSEYLDAYSGTTASFACLLGEEYSAFAPYTMILNEISERYALSAANALADFPTEELLRRCAFNTHAKGYTESSGTTVIPDGQRILRLQKDGLLVYSGGSDIGSLFSVASAGNDLPSPAEAVSAAHSLVSGILQGRLGDGTLYCSDVRSTANGYYVNFDYMVGGTPVLLADGSHAAEVCIENHSITAFSLRLRRYALSDIACPLLPLAQTVAIASDTYPNRELSVAYVDSFGDSLSAEWVVD